jgi:hypothetical protein
LGGIHDVPSNLPAPKANQSHQHRVLGSTSPVRLICRRPSKCFATMFPLVGLPCRRVELHSPECVEWLPHQHRLDIVGKTMWIYYIAERPH